MLCQYCKTNTADYRLFYNYNGHVNDVHLCADCAEKLHKQYQEFLAHMESYLGGWNPSHDEESKPFWAEAYEEHTKAQKFDSDRIPTDDVEAIRLRRQLGEMRMQLQKAVSSEDYERAARLRDEIAGVENKVMP